MQHLAPLVLLCVLALAYPPSMALSLRSPPRSRACSKCTYFRDLRMTIMQEDVDSSESIDNGTINSSLLSASALLGALETGYLTLSRLTHSDVYGGLCAAGSSGSTTCSDVLSGPYSVLPFTDIPLAAIAFAGYSTVSVWSIASGGSKASSGGGVVLALSTAMATFSLYLMMVLTFVIHSSCSYCYVSAVLSITMAVNAFYGKGVVSSKTRAFVVSMSSAGVAAVASALLFYATDVHANEKGSSVEATAASATLNSMQTQNDAEIEKKRPPALTSHSTSEAMQLAKRLKSLDAKMYGAYWCSHCNNQKQQLGIEAYEQQLFKYVECDKDGFESQYPLCRSSKIPGYPTWEIQGQFFPGEKSVSELSTLLKQFD